jgi:cytosine/adenosine deaminase-related metal-dependent hydrolase
MILRARAILPVSRPPIENGAVVISGNTIRAVGSWPDLRARPDEEILDLGEVVLLPGLVNAHCHLDYTDMAGEFLPPKSFTDWIKLITAAKGGWTYSDFAQSWLNGAQMLLRHGTTTVADFENVPELLPEVWSATTLRVLSFLEMTGVKSRRDPGAILDEAVERINSLGKFPRSAASLAPHAPYSTVPDLLRLTAATARRRGWRLATHVAESVEESEMFHHARGVMFDWLARNQRDNSDCGLGSPVAHLARNDMLGENLIAIHANLLAPGDAELLGKSGVHVVHCPRSHDYFRHPPFPRLQLASAGVNLCLGTDSLSTVRKTGKEMPDLNLFEEMRALAAADKTVSPVEILRMATVNGAKALGMAGQIGELSENSFADLIAVPFAGKTADICETVVHHASTVSASMIDGQWAIAP